MVAECRDGRAAWLNKRQQVSGSRSWVDDPDHPEPVTIPAPTAVIAATPDPEVLGPGLPDLYLPLIAAAEQYLADRPVTLAVEGAGGIGVEQQLEQALAVELPEAAVITTRAFANYVQSRDIVLVLKLVTLAVIGLGLLAFVVAGVDEVLARRTSITSLLLLGTKKSTVRAAQAYETVIPLAVGLPAAIGLGWISGNAFVALNGLQPFVSWQAVLGTATVAMVGVIVVAIALITVSVPRIEPANIRRG